MRVLTPTENRAFCITFLGFAQLLTIARIWIRHRAKRLWWDDAWALLTTLISVVITSALFITDGFPGLGVGNAGQVVQYWLLMLSFTISLWCARMSLIFSIIRLIPPLFTLRRISEWAAFMFLLMSVGVCIPKIYKCASDRSWHHFSSVSCHLGTRIAIGELVTDCVADVILAAIPIQLLRGVSLTNDKRRMLIIMFGASLLISSISIVHVIFLIRSTWSSVGLTAEAEVGVAIIVANLCVLSPYVYRLVKKEGGDFDSKPYTYYHSFQANGNMQLRRVSDLASAQHRSTLVSAIHFGPDLEMQHTSSKVTNVSDASIGRLQEGRDVSIPLKTSHLSDGMVS